jgi:phosphoribosylanthranilate isomerase
LRAPYVKICGVTRIEDADVCLSLGVASIGLNFVPESPRCIPLETARAIAAHVGGRALVVGVVRDLSAEGALALREAVPLGCLQLHGDEPPEVLSALLPHAYKAFRIGTLEDVERAASYPGEHLLVDAKVEGMLGGTGQTVDPALVASLARTRKLTLAGGLTAENVREAIARVSPYCVDVASGVESAPGIKDADKIAAFVRAARG